VDSGAGLLHVPHAGSYLPFLRSNSSLTSSYTTLKKTNGYTLSPATVPKCGAIKRVSFTSNYLTLICQSGSVLLFQRVSQSEAITCQSNSSSTAFKNTRVNGCWSKLLQKSKSHIQKTRQLISQRFDSDNPSLWKLMERKLEHGPQVWELDSKFRGSL